MPVWTWEHALRSEKGRWYDSVWVRQEPLPLGLQAKPKKACATMNVGEKVGRYEITAFLGKGGMGEVFRARDAHLKRDVAIKISASQFDHRVRREAEAVAALNHPASALCTMSARTTW